jgi:hypothetical protein
MQAKHKQIDVQGLLRIGVPKALVQDITLLGSLKRAASNQLKQTGGVWKDLATQFFILTAAGTTTAISMAVASGEKDNYVLMLKVAKIGTACGAGVGCIVPAGILIIEGLVIAEESAKIRTDSRRELKYYLESLSTK